MKYSIIYYIWIHYPISILYEELYSCDFTKNIWMRFFIQINISVWIHKTFLKKHYHLKNNKNFEEGFVSKNPISLLLKMLDEMKNICPQNNIKCIKKQENFLVKMYHCSLFSPGVSFMATWCYLQNPYHNGNWLKMWIFKCYCN